MRVGGSRYVQKSGAISFGQARAQVQERATEEWIQEGRKEVVNFAEQRATRAQIKRDAKVERAIQREREKLQREDQLERKDAVKLAVSVLEKAITRLGLRALVQQSTNNLTSDFWKPLEWHIKHKGELWDQQKDMQATVDKYIEWRVRWLGVLWDLRPVGAGIHVFYRKMVEKAMLRKRGLGIQQKLKLDQKNGVYYYHLIEGNMPYYPLFQEVDFN